MPRQWPDQTAFLRSMRAAGTMLRKQPKPTDRHLSDAEVRLRETYPQLVFDAEPPEYWCGRFNALHDRCLSEQLEPEALKFLLEMRSGKIAAANVDKNQNAPSAVAKTGIPKPAKTMMTLSASTATLGGRATAAPLADSSSMPRIPMVTPRYTSFGSLSLQQQRYPGPGPGPGRPPPLLKQSNTLSSLPPPGPRSPEPPAIQPAVLSSQILASRANWEAHLLQDEDARYKRVFAQLESLCATAQARASLARFRIEFARAKDRSAPTSSAMPRMPRGTKDRRAEAERKGAQTGGGGGFGLGKLFGRERVKGLRLEVSQ